MRLTHTGGLEEGLGTGEAACGDNLPCRRLLVLWRRRQPEPSLFRAQGPGPQLFPDAPPAQLDGGGKVMMRGEAGCAPDLPAALVMVPCSLGHWSVRMPCSLGTFLPTYES